MKRPLAVLDTSVIVLLLTKMQDQSAEERETERRRQAVREIVGQMQSKYRFGIPSVVVAELGRDGSAQKDLEKIVGVMGRFRVLSLTLAGGLKAAEIARRALGKRSRQPGSERGAVKFDALICATAQAYDAECIVTENPRDFAKYLAEVGSNVEVRVPSEPPKHGQIHILQHKPKKK